MHRLYPHRGVGAHSKKTRSIERVSITNYGLWLYPIFVAVEPLVGKRKTFVTDQRTKQDFAELLRFLSDDEYPGAEKKETMLYFYA